MFRIRNLVEKNGIGTISKFKVARYATSLLGGVQADVILTYSNKKEIMITGDEDSMFLTPQADVDEVLSI